MKVYLIRHSEPDFQQVNQSGYMGYGRDLTRLTHNGIEIAQKASKSPILNEIQLLLVSPYTRTMETAMELVRGRNIKTQVELNLFEWRPDKTGRELQTDEQVKQAYSDYKNGTTLGTMNPETPNDIVNRVNSVLDKYKDKYDCIGCVTHGEVIRQMANIKPDIEIPYCEIYQIEY